MSVSVLSEEQTHASQREPDSKRTQSQLMRLLFCQCNAKLAVIAALITGLPSIGVYILIGHVIDALTEAALDPKLDAMPRISLYCVYIALVAFAGGIAKGFSSSYWTKAGSALTIKLREMLFTKLMRSDVASIDEYQIGSLLTLLNEDALLVQDAFGPSKGVQIQNIGQVLGAVIAHFCYSWRTALIYVSAVVLVNALVPIFSCFLRKYEGMKFDSFSEGLTIAQEAFANMRTVRGFNREARELDRFRATNSMTCTNEKKLGLVIIAMKVTMSIIFWSNIVVNFYYAGVLAEKGIGNLETGDVFLVFGFCVLANFGIVGFQTTMQAEQKAVAAASRIFDLCNRQCEIPFDDGLELEDIHGKIEFVNVSFRYPSREMYSLRNVSFTIEPGQTAALVGSSGCGKSTCIQLIERFYNPTEGTILLDGHDILELNPRWIHQHIGLVSQDPVLFRASIRDNITYGACDVSDEQLRQACEIANISDCIDQLPNGLDEMITERGTSLSGGQRQRIAIARAVIKNPSILITDEATSALDACTENNVQHELERVMRHRTSIIVAHRLSTIRCADVIYLLAHGEILEFGTHDQLLEQRGAYYSLISHQLHAEHLKR